MSTPFPKPLPSASEFSNPDGGAAPLNLGFSALSSSPSASGSEGIAPLDSAVTRDKPVDLRLDEDTTPTLPPPDPQPLPPIRQPDRGRWIYQAWLLGMLGVMGLTAGASLWSLVSLPQNRDCPRLIQSFASASLKLYCAQVAASQGTTEGLVQAINLVNSLPSDHPLRTNGDQYLKRWAFDLVVLAEKQYNDGYLDLALESLNAIPLDRLPCDENQCPREEIQTWKDEWQALWQQGEKIYRDAEQALLEQNWDRAAAEATKLLALDNRYWQVTRYNELNAQIQEVRDSNSNLARAKKLADQGGVSNLRQAIDLAAQVEPSSRLYDVAQAQVANYSRKILDLAQEALDRKNLSEALAIVDQIPEIGNLQGEIKDFKVLAEASSKTWSGQVSDYRDAIAQLQRLESDRPLYNKAQGLVQRWQQEIEDLAHLDRGRTLAKRNSITGYMTAIAEVSLIPAGHPRHQEAETLINQWNGEIELLEDSPYLDRANRLAEGGSIASLQAAIEEANQIRPDRRLYDEAQDNIAGWQKDIERLEDQPYLDQARNLANSGNLEGAIAAASNIDPGRFLYGEAQGLIDDWQLQIDAEYNLRQAEGFSASSQTPESLGAAIRSANQVANQTPQRATAEANIERWSEQLLQIAIERSGYDLIGAIEVAERIPSNTAVSAEAQAYIRFWQEALGQ